MFNKTIFIEAITITIITSGIFYLFSTFSINIDFLDPIENTISDIELTDLYFSTFQDQRNSIDTNIVLINFAELEREDISKVVAEINKYNPRVIGIDAFFSPQTQVEADSSIAETFSKVNNLVLVSILRGDFNSNSNKNKPYLLLPAYYQKSKVGYANLKEDGAFRTIRSFRPLVNIDGKDHLSFSAEICKTYSQNSIKKLLVRNYPEEVINFKGNKHNFYNLSAKDILGNKQNLFFLNDKIVILGFLGREDNGFSHRDFEDKFFTPLNKKYIGRGDPDMFGAVIHANIISMILNEHYINNLSDVLRYSLFLFIIFINSFMFLLLYQKYHHIYSSISKVIIILESITLLFISFVILHNFNLKIELKPILIGIVFLPDLLETYKSILLKIKEKK